jgi:hypothetical protein
MSKHAAPRKAKKPTEGGHDKPAATGEHQLRDAQLRAAIVDECIKVVTQHDGDTPVIVNVLEGLKRNKRPL